MQASMKQRLSTMFSSCPAIMGSNPGTQQEYLAGT